MALPQVILRSSLVFVVPVLEHALLLVDVQEAREVVGVRRTTHAKPATPRCKLQICWSTSELPNRLTGYDGYRILTLTMVTFKLQHL